MYVCSSARQTYPVYANFGGTELEAALQSMKTADIPSCKLFPDREQFANINISYTGIVHK